MATADSNDLMENTLREALDKNQYETQMCQEYKNDLHMATRNLQSFQNKLRVDVMVPLGAHALMPGYLYHTNEVLIGKPTGLFIESTAGQAVDIVQQRLKVADQRLKDLQVEAEFFRNKLEHPLKTDAFLHGEQKEIIEEYDEEAEKNWKLLHRQKVKDAKMREREMRNNPVEDTEFQSIMENLDELEMMEELQDEFDVIVAPDPVDLSGHVQFKEKPRQSYQLESFTCLPEKPSSLVDKESRAVLADTQPSAPSVESYTEGKSSTKKEKRKSLQFSEDLERVKLIHKTERPNTLFTKYDPELTLELQFRHSPVEFNPPKDIDSSVIRSPVDIYKQFAHCMKHYTGPQSEDEDKPRSILKKTSQKILVDKKATLHSEELQRERVHEEDNLPQSGRNIYQEVVGDVLERNSSKSVGQENKKEDQQTKRVSRFKAMRS